MNVYIAYKIKLTNCSFHPSNLQKKLDTKYHAEGVTDERKEEEIQIG